jgi:hypothetical protein
MEEKIGQAVTEKRGTKESKHGENKIYFRETSKRNSATEETTGEGDPPHGGQAAEIRY